MKLRLFIAFTGISSLLFLNGCLASDTDIGVLKTQIAALNETLRDVQRSQSATDQHLEDVTAQLTQSADNLKDFDYKLDNISTKLDNIYARITTADDVKAKYQMLPGNIYDEAKTQYDAAQYDGAIKGFELYIKTAPDGHSIQESYFFLARSYYQKKEYQKAAVSAATLLDKYPQSRYSAEARILYAQSIVPLNKKDEARNYLKSVVQDFPNTPQAKEAEKLLKTAPFAEPKPPKQPAPASAQAPKQPATAAPATAPKQPAATATKQPAAAPKPASQQ